LSAYYIIGMLLEDLELKFLTPEQIINAALSLCHGLNLDNRDMRVKAMTAIGRAAEFLTPIFKDENTRQKVMSSIITCIKEADEEVRKTGL
jgi:hypothetical protein